MSLFYVHWYYGTQGSGGDKTKQNSKYDAKYNEKIANQLADISGKELAKRFKKVIKSTYKFTKDSEVSQFLKNERELFKELGFQKAVDEAFNLVHNAAPFFNKTDKEISQSLITNPKTQAVKFNSDLEKVTRKMIQFSNHCTQIMQNGDTQAYLAFLKHYASSDLAGILDKLGDEKSLSILTKAKENLAEKEFKQLKNEEKEIQSYIDELNKITASYGKGGELTKTKEQNMISYVRSLFTAQARMAGNLMELIFTDVSNALIEAKLIKNINFPNLKVLHTGDKVSAGSGNTAFAKYTTDSKIKLDINIPDINISIKRYKDFNGSKLPNVKLKSANLKSMLNIVQNQTKLFDDKQRGAFYNIMANHGRHVTKNAKGGGGGSIYDFEGINQYFDKLKKVMLIPAIAGSLTKEDLSTLFLINNKVYSIVDILSHIDEASITSNLSSINKTVRAGHRWIGAENDKSAAEKRSDNVINALLNNTVKLSLSLSLARIKAIS